MTPPDITLYGIAHCDTVKKSRAWFTAQGLDYRFHDFKKLGVPADRLGVWTSTVGWEKLVNRQGTTWRKLDAAAQAAVQDAASAQALVREHASVIKRPVVEWRQGGATHVSVGFATPEWEQWRGPQPT